MDRKALLHHFAIFYLLFLEFFWLIRQRMAVEIRANKRNIIDGGVTEVVVVVVIDSRVGFMIVEVVVVVVSNVVAEMTSTVNTWLLSEIK